MQHVSELSSILNKSFKWNKARITIFSQMLITLFVTRTVNLNKLSSVISSKAEQSSVYRRIQRFFATFIIDFDMIAVFIY